jgi:hypothetical protein
MVRASKIDPSLFAEVESDRDASAQAAAVVMLAALANAVSIAGAPLAMLALGVVAALVGWLLFASAIYLIGAKLLPEPGTRPDFGALLRAVGFANAPGMLKLLGVVPGLREPVFFVATVWVFVATVTAVRHALCYTSAWRAVGVCAVPLLASYLLLLSLVSSVGDVSPAGPGSDEPPVVLP